jgi:CDGSH-type Zn-finger protein
VVTGSNAPPPEPLLVEGPVDMVLEDGARVRSDRFMVAICRCRRSKRYPLCDTSHRLRVRSEDTPESHAPRR